MSITGKFIAHAKDLDFFGDSLDNSLTISRDGAGHLLGNGGAIAISGGVATVDNIDVIRAFGDGGNDVITLDETNGPLPAARLFGGAGNDFLTGGSGDDILQGQAGNDTLIGHAGNDRLFGGAGNDFIDGDQGADIGFLGDGNDVFRWDQGDGSDRVEGGSGFDQLLFNGNPNAETFTFTADTANDALFTRVQGNIVMTLNDVENITVNALAGADTITINDPSGTKVTEFAINLGLNGLGDGAVDKIFINDDDDVQVVNNGNGNLTVLDVSGATVHITGFEVGSDQLFINGHLFGV